MNAEVHIDVPRSTLMHPMKRRVKRRWLNALRSAAYRQGTDALRFENTFCCLGVLCDLHARETFMQWDYDDASGLYRYLGETTLLPRAVCEWAGLDEQNPQALRLPLSGHNDVKRRSFEYMSGLIERHL